ncbi:MAG: 3-deoxy-D-manno-octulosonic acid transferase [Candidatus Symbiobacter sp.]|nr:3-deoxy-D-manno-octulosonic acid transferase [Candidatus Symbiobacter sp.]
MGVFLYWLYRLLSLTVAPPILSLLLSRRLRRGKEHGLRWSERLGVAGLPRPPGCLVWIHAASVGEAMVALTLVDALRRNHPDWNLLLTSGTVTSAKLIDDRLKKLTTPPAVIFVHQFVPYDLPKYVKAFLDHWRPDLALWLESELWPNLILATAKRKIPILLLNARMSVGSLRKWRWARPLIRLILRQFAKILAQSALDQAHFRQLGANASQFGAVGNLKFSAGTLPLPISEREFNQVQNRLRGEKIWLAASTHDPEEMIAAAIHVALLDRHPGLITIIVPRHPERGASIEAAFHAEFSQPDAALALYAGRDKTGRDKAGRDKAGRDNRSITAIPFIRRSRDNDLSELQPGRIYLADTLGELGLWYRLAAIAFIGGSLVPHGGQNPLEAARLGSALLVGPSTSNFTAIIEGLYHAKAVHIVQDGGELRLHLDALFSDPALREQLAVAGSTFAAYDADDLLLSNCIRAIDAVWLAHHPKSGKS